METNKMNASGSGVTAFIQSQHQTVNNTHPSVIPPQEVVAGLSGVEHSFLILRFPATELEQRTIKK